MIEFTIELQLFKKMCKAVSLNGIVETPSLIFSQDCLEAINRDLADATLSYCKFSSEYFMKYTYVDEQTDKRIFVSSEALFKAIKSLSGEAVQVSIEGESLSMKTDKQKAVIPMLEGGTISSLPDSMKVINGDVSLVDNMVFQIEEIIPVISKGVDSLGASDSIFIIKDGTLSLFQGTDDGSSFESELLKGLNSIDFFVILDTMYLTSLFDSVMDENVKLKLGKELPVVMENKAKNRDTIFVLMPKIASDKNV